MRLIKAIEIGYFRSFYYGELHNTQDLNVIFGKNDAGKSNVLRALNLFFNYETNPNLLFEFSRDFSHYRRTEAKSYENAKKFVSVKVTFQTPAEYQQSLTKEFFIRRQWQTGSDPRQPLEIFPKKLARNKHLAKRFLNTIDFHYIPAIKDRQIFEFLLGKIYTILAADAKFEGSLQSFATEIENRTGELTASLREELGFSSVISPPSDLANLFRSLDFETSDNEENPLSLILQRGDGVQVRHIPEILNFISNSSQSVDRHIWGFEEPENSLELSSSVKLAELFEEFSSDSNKQIFITSHSPAFFGIRGENVGRYFVRSMSDEIGAYSEIEKLEDESAYKSAALMGEIPHLPLISDALLAASEQVNALEQQKRKLQDKLKKDNRPILWVEGPTDEIAVLNSWKALFPKEKMPFEVLPSEGTKNMIGLTAGGPFRDKYIGERLTFALADNDPDGRGIWNSGHLRAGNSWKLMGNQTWWRLLKCTKEYEDICKEFGVPKEKWAFTLESCFSFDTRRRAISDGAFELQDFPYECLIAPNSAYTRKIFEAIQNRSEVTDQRLCFLPATPEGKTKFVEWLSRGENMTKDIYCEFEPILSSLCEQIAVQQRKAK